MRNTYNLSLALFCTAMLFSACQKDYTEPGPGIENRGEPIELKISIADGDVTRLSTDLNFNTSFQEGDAIGIFAVHREDDDTQAFPEPEGNYVHNYKYVRDEDGRWAPETEGDQLYYTQAGLIDIYAYYPYIEDADPTGIEYDASVSSYDLMTARQIAVGKGSGDVNLIFSHKLALVHTEINGIPDAGGGVTVIMQKARNKAALNLAAPTQAAELTVVDYLDDIEFNYNMGYFRAYIPAQTVAGGSELFFIDAYGNDLYYRNPTADTFIAGSVKRYSIMTSISEYINMPNSYMVVPGGSVSIPVGKAYEAWETVPQLLALGQDMSGAVTAEITWQTPYNLVSYSGVTVTGNGRNSYINVNTVRNSGNGNAVVVLKIDGIVRWSWHIWVSDYNAHDPALYKTNNGVTFMDRNLGATSNTPGDPKTIGMHYVWGRKDPIPGPNTWDNNFQPVYNRSAVQTTFTEFPISENRNENLMAVMSNPLTYIITESGFSGDWYSKDGTNQWYDRWIKEDGSKGIFDPCPAGWRVPASGMGQASPWYGLLNRTWDREKHGIDWPEAGYYPAGGVLNSINRTISMGGEGAYYYSSTWGIHNEQEKAWALYMDQLGAIDKSYAYTFGHGLNVRCVKE